MANDKFFDQFNAGKGIPFMESRTKGNLHDMLDKPLHIVDFGFITGENDPYAVILFAESDKFYFGNTIITEVLQKVEDADKREALKSETVIFHERENKKGSRTYTAIEFL